LYIFVFIFSVQIVRGYIFYFMLAESKIIEELDALSIDEKEYVKDLLDKMLIEQRREAIHLNAMESRREFLKVKPSVQTA